MKFKKSHNPLLFSILIIFSLQLIGLGVLFFSPVKEVMAQNGGAGYPPGTGYSDLEGKNVTPQISGSDSGNATLTPGGINFTPQVDIPGSEFVKGSPKTIDGLMIAMYIQAWYKFAVAAVGILAVVMIMGGGLIWLTAGGEANKISTAKEWIMGAVIGLILALMSYTLLDILNPSLVTFKSLDIPEIKFVDSGVCCFSDGPKQANTADVDGSCVFDDKENKIYITGKRCNVLQACRNDVEIIDGVERGDYHCVDITEDIGCSDATKDCLEGWFCVNGKCSNGSENDWCDLNAISCSSEYYCAPAEDGAKCYDGKKGDICSIKDNKCNEPMICSEGLLKGLALNWGTCQYTTGCIPANQPCGRNMIFPGIIGNLQCCKGDCDCDISNKCTCKSD